MEQPPLGGTAWQGRRPRVAMRSWIEGRRQSVPHRILMLGLHGSGKTSCARRLLGEPIADIIPPTTSLNIFELEHRGARLETWDVGGAEAWSRPLPMHYFPNTDGVVLVVDSADLDRMGSTEAGAEAWDSTAASMLRHLLAVPELRDAPFLTLANKSDRPDAQCVEVRLRLGVDALMRSARRSWHMTSSSAMTGEGLQGGFDWLVRELESRRHGDLHLGVLLSVPEYNGS